MAMPTSAQEVFDDLVPKGLAQFPDKASELNSIYCFKISGEGGGDWTVDTVAKPPTCTKGASDTAQCTIEVSNDFKTMPRRSERA
jgi:hypothetical protein